MGNKIQQIIECYPMKANDQYNISISDPNLYEAINLKITSQGTQENMGEKRKASFSLLI